MARSVFILSLLSLCFSFSISASHVGGEEKNESRPAAENENKKSDDGIRFTCRPADLSKIELGMESYLAKLDIAPDLIIKKKDKEKGTLLYTLSTPNGDTDTVHLNERKNFKIQDETIELPMAAGKTKTVKTVSKKEILLSLMQHGRLTEFKGSACDVDALIDHVGIRQNTVVWTENTYFIWPDGKSADWNAKYWQDGMPKKGVSAYEAIHDMYLNPKEYAIGCYPAAKVAMVHGALDYYARVKPDAAKLKLIEDRLKSKGRLLEYIHSVDKNPEKNEPGSPGKVVRTLKGATPDNIIAGDWLYLVNPDPKSSAEVGYEGSNAIVYGRNRIDDFYKDMPNGYYTFTEKLNEVYHWRNGLYLSWHKDRPKIKLLTEEELKAVKKTPAEGGILPSERDVPFYFGYEELPPP